MFISNAGTEMSAGVVVLTGLVTADGASPLRQLHGADRNAGYSTGNKLRGIGWRGLDTRELMFDDVFVPDENLIGDLNQGLGQFLATLEVGRISVAALAVSLIKGVLDLAAAVLRSDRHQFGAPISSYQAIQFKLADIGTEYEAVPVARLPGGRAARRREALSHRRRRWPSCGPVESAVWAASEAVQIHGGLGYMEETPVARFYCDAKVLEIGEGTNEIQHIVIARDLLA